MSELNDSTGESTSLGEAPGLPPGTTLAGRYRVERRLGEGGMGSVYLVQHLKTDERLALKVLHEAVVKDKAALDRFQREARTPARIQSDHVVRVIDADVAPEIGGVPFLVMEYLRGEDLDQVLAARGALPPAEVILYLRQAARALDKAHAMGIIHRDLKPENLFLTEREDGTPCIKLLDFGIAKLTGAAGDLARVGSRTSTGQIFGTPLFMSPEQALAESAKISPRTDVWALGLIAHKLLSGDDIWTATNLTQLIAQIAYEPMPVPSKRGCAFGAAYDAWFAACCARDPAERFASAGEAVSALAAALGIHEMPSSLAVPLSDRAGLPSSAPEGASPSDPVGGDHASAVTVASVDSAGLGAGLRQSAGPLTRTHASAAGGRRKGPIVGMVVVGIVGGVALGLWLSRGGAGTPPAPAAAEPTARPAEPVVEAPVPSAPVATGPVVEPAPTPPEPQASAAASASAAPPKPPVAVAPVMPARVPAASKLPALAQPAATTAPVSGAPPAAPAKNDDDPLRTRH